MSKQITITVESDIKRALEEKAELVERAMIMCGELFEGEAKDEISRPKAHADGSIRPNVDTGRLRNSITYATHTMHSGGAVEEGTCIVGTNVEYAAYVEMGTSRSRPYPYLKPAVENSIPTVKRILENTLKS